MSTRNEAPRNRCVDWMVDDATVNIPHAVAVCNKLSAEARLLYGFCRHEAIVLGDEWRYSAVSSRARCLVGYEPMAGEALIFELIRAQLLVVETCYAEQFGYEWEYDFPVYLLRPNSLLLFDSDPFPSPPGFDGMASGQISTAP